ncbi:MAG: GAF domain-containing sensor histidine kinase [Cryomorphaceae bacterium]|nr:GAF domain-containing sensor histidine kinase [Cryomorphaceae bacterium]
MKANQTHDLISLFPKVSEIVLREKKLDRGLQEVLTLLGEATGVDRVYYFKNYKKDGVLYGVYHLEWCVEGVEPQIDQPDLNHFSYPSLEGFYTDFVKSKSLVSEDVTKLPYNRFRELMIEQNILSALLIKVSFEKDFLGFVGFDSCKSKRKWKPEEVRILEHLADIIAHRIVRESALEASQAYLNRIERRNEFLAEVRSAQSAFIENPKSNTVFEKLLTAICTYTDFEKGIIVSYIAPHTNRKKGNPTIIAKSTKASDADMDAVYLINEKCTEVYLDKKGQKYLRWANRHKKPIVFDFFSENFELEFDLKKAGENKAGNKSLVFPVFFGNILMATVYLINARQIQKSIPALMEELGSVTDSMVHIFTSIRFNYEKSVVEDLAENQRRSFRQLIEKTLSGYWEISPNGNFTSRKLLQTLGYSDVFRLENEISTRWTDHVVKEDVDAFYFMVEKKIVKARRINQTISMEMRFKHRKGKILTMLVGAIINVTENGALQIFGCNVDISNAADLSRTLKINLKKEQELNKLKSHFISVVSHQFRTPMSVIQSNTEIIAKKSEEVIDLHKNIQRIYDEIARMNQLIEKVLTMERLQLEESSDQISQFSLKELIESLIARYDDNGDNFFLFNTDLNGEKSIISSDKEKLEAIIDNILSNAIKYGGNRQREVNLILDNKHKKFILSVKDFGMGIPKSNLESIFTPFTRAENVSHLEGTGLGLSIAKEYAQRLNIQIEVKSKLNSFSEFLLYIPSDY